jgi:O-6-methylguanine DNA methyltransferase
MKSIGLYSKASGGVWFGVACDEKTVYATNFASTQEKVLKGLKESIPSKLSAAESSGPSGLAKKVLASLEDIYYGRKHSDNLPLDYARLPVYTRRVIDAVSKIPLGYVTSYGLVAKAVGGAPIAVGQVMAKNPFAPLCPCHRVVASDFTLHGYGGGLDAKLAFLKREKKGYASERVVDVGGKKLRVFPIERVLEKHRGKT